jgi:type II secretory pathway component PulM
VKEWWNRLLAFFETLSPNERLLLSIAGGLFAVLFVFLGVVNPVRSAISGARERTTAADQQLAAALRLQTELSEIRGRLDAVEDRIRKGPRGNIFTTLEALAKESAVKVDSMEPQSAQSNEAYRETKVEVTLKAVSLAQLANYLHRIESAAQLLSIKSLRMRTRPDKPELLDVSFTVSSFEAA